MLRINTTFAKMISFIILLLIIAGASIGGIIHRIYYQALIEESFKNIADESHLIYNQP